MLEVQIRQTCPDCKGTGNARACTPCNGTGKTTEWVPAVATLGVLSHVNSEEEAQQLIAYILGGTISPDVFDNRVRRQEEEEYQVMLAGTDKASTLAPLSTEHVQVAVQTWPLSTQLTAFALLQKMHTPLKVLEYQSTNEDYPAFLMRELERENLESFTLQQLCQTGVATLTQIHHLSEPSTRQIHHLAASAFLSFNA